MPKSLDEQIAEHLQQALDSGELQRARGFGQPLPETPGWDETPAALRMPLKILKDAGVAPPEVALFHERARLRAELDSCTHPGERERLRAELADLEQKIALRLEALRINARL